eukprot:4710256-Amphidinium_carterae.1
MDYRPTIPQSDSELSIIELFNEATKQIPHLRCQQAPHQSLQSQGTVERYHQTLFAQLRTFQFCRNYNVDNRSMSCRTRIGMVPIGTSLLKKRSMFYTEFLEDGVIRGKGAETKTLMVSKPGWSPLAR